MSSLYSPNPNPEHRTVSIVTKSHSLDGPRFLIMVSYMWDRIKHDFHGDLEKTVKIAVSPDGPMFAQKYTRLETSYQIKQTGLNNKGFLEFSFIVMVPIGDLKAKVSLKAAEATFSGPTHVTNVMVDGKLDGEAQEVDVWANVMRPEQSRH